ncbi:branched-chain amino acid ABC transporter permease [Siminovitchia sp. 179-K 8D1 HS]|uniref:branched-chain amino acid ABC transporter permease n=1 Tax=Siminovitchia sp. 179-K 8D1 HS TaxID=3142385 RepID=UPI0039A1E041
MEKTNPIVKEKAVVPRLRLMKNQYVYLLAGLLIFGFFPHLFGPYLTSVFIIIGIYSITTVGLTILMGNAGLVSLAQAAFWGIGAYGTGILTVKYEIPVLFSVVVGIIFSSIAGFILIYVTRNLEGHYFTLATLGFGIVINIILIEESTLTGGSSGLLGIPGFSIGNFALASESMWFYFIWTIVILVVLLSRNLVKSGWGRNLRSMNSSLIASQSMGINTGKYKVKAFVISASFAGLSGGLYASYMGFISPAVFNFEMSIKFVVMAVIGGLLSIYGALVGAIVITLLVEVLREFIPTLFSDTSAGGAVEVIFFGALLMVMMVYLPNGIMGIIKQAKTKFSTGGRFS